MTEEKKPETVAWENIFKDEIKVVGEKVKNRDFYNLKRQNELIRRSDGEENYEKKNKGCEICGVEDVLVDIEIDGKKLSFCPEHFEGLKDSDVSEIVKHDERQRIKSEVKDKIWSNLTQKEMLKIIEGENN